MIVEVEIASEVTQVTSATNQLLDGQELSNSAISEDKLLIEPETQRIMRPAFHGAVHGIANKHNSSKLRPAIAVVS
jgi:hypothetical protein